MTTGADLVYERNALAADRIHFDDVWQDVVAYAMPMGSWRYDHRHLNHTQPLTGYENRPRAAERSRRLFDSSAALALDRLTSAMESMVSPQSQKWHNLTSRSFDRAEPSDIESEWYDTLRDHLFSTRYDARSGFLLANQKAIRSACGIGTGVVYTQENQGQTGVDPGQVPIFYSHVPLAETMLGIDALGSVNKAYRSYGMTATAAMEYFKGKVSGKVKEAAGDFKKRSKRFSFMHCVVPLEQANDGRHKDKPYASFWVDLADKSIISRDGFYEFPYHVYWWEQIDQEPYGQSPVMAMLGDIRMLQLMSKHSIEAMGQYVKPPMATMAGIYKKRPNLNPGKINPGYLDEAGRLKIQPIVAAKTPDVAQQAIQERRTGINDGLYITLFQTLVQNPNMTATEAMIRAEEKGNLLGPVGGRFELALGSIVDREVNIFGRKGYYEAGRLMAPETIQDVQPAFTNQLARFRRMPELTGMMRVLEMLGPLMQDGSPEAQRLVKKLDRESIAEITQDIMGAPQKMFRTEVEVDALMEQEEQAQAAMMAMQAANSAADTANKAAPAIETLQRVGQQLALPAPEAA